MNKRNILKIGIPVVLVLLFLLVLFTFFQFQNKSEDVVIDDRNPSAEGYVLDNQSDYSQEELMAIVEGLRQSFRDFLNNIEYYTPSEIRSDLDDENYMVVSLDLFERLSEILSTSLYEEYFSLAEEVLPDADVAIEETLYQVPLSMFDVAFSQSAVAVNDVNEESLFLTYASNSEIRGIVEIRLCENDLCSRMDEYEFQVVFEDDWKIARFY